MVQPEKCLLKKSHMCPISLKHNRELKKNKRRKFSKCLKCFRIFYKKLKREFYK